MDPEKILHSADGFELFIQEDLPAESRVDSHDQNQIQIVHERQEGFSGSAGTQRDTCFFPAAPYDGQGSMDVFLRVRFNMTVHKIRTCLAEALYIAQGSVNHQMDVQKGLCRFPDRGKDRQPKRNILHKRPVHHIEMDRICSAGCNICDLLPEPGKVRRKDRRRDFDHFENLFSMYNDTLFF